MLTFIVSHSKIENIITTAFKKKNTKQYYLYINNIEKFLLDSGIIIKKEYWFYEYIFYCECVDIKKFTWHILTCGELALDYTGYKI